MARAFGGWGGFIRGEDASLTWLYRKHDGQTTASPLEHLPQLSDVSAQRIAAIREVFGSRPGAGLGRGTTPR